MSVVMAVLVYLQSQGSHVSLNESHDGPSLVLYTGYSKSAYVDVTEGEPREGFVLIPESKGRYTRMRHPVDYWVVSDKVAVVVPECHIGKELLTDGFYRVPLENCIYIDLE